MTNNNPWAPPSNEGPERPARSGSILIIALIVLLAVIAGVTWFLMSRSSSEPTEHEARFTQVAPTSAESGSTNSKTLTTSVETSTTKPVTSKNTSQDRCGAAAEEIRNDIPRPMTLLCNDEWLYLATENSSSFYLFTWGGAEWTPYKNDGVDDTTSVKCWDADRLKADNAPTQITGDIPLCADSTENIEAQETCDGRYILIVDSLLVPYGESPQSEIDRVKSHYAEVNIMPGTACSSLRSEHEGKQVYAAYYDAGHSVDEVCKLKARYGGNARSLNNDADFSDPC
ncbi:hypothetical protein [Corynebacterium aurimucosum]|uniref:Putative membrane protein n=1 Tax=Corynebacterium aurimucosum (strain ATCC 700975 / DSM 44827 / CIP 107346 / CN-1) TaxID=548476 RepID=C3PK21_CORA7|nr:hypothetical protein [Corynebacterium aurimucosum]ACP33922.1 putative membrane protein [Corynebacterium aurimucosum ATCC 700975]QQU91990.1 hypothetical protein I6I67_06870 [Corynebacterium aurimucosum]